MNLQKLEKACRWLFGIVVVGAIIFSTSAIEFLPFIIGIVFLAALAGFPGFRRQIRWRRVFFFGAAAMVVIPGMYYWAVLNNTDDTIADFCLWTVWPLVDEKTNSGITLPYWLLFWVLKGLLFGFIIESLSALNKQRGVKRAAACVRRDSEAEGNVPPFGLAGILSMTCLAVIFLSVRFLAGLTPRLNEWLIPAYIIIGPVATAFFTIYRSSWQRELSGKQRMVAIMLRSGLIFGVVLFVILLIFVAIGFLAALEVPRGQYGQY
jgi:hypothetical protein